MPALVVNHPPAPAIPSFWASLRRKCHRHRLTLAVALVVLAAVAAYRNALGTPFVFDDQFAIVENPTIRHLGNLADVLRPPPFASGAAGRPLVNLTLALNYAVGGLQPGGYHVLNLVLHALTALTLFGLLRRTLEKTALAAEAFPVALAAAVVWTVHPLLTESVTCVIQRNEILAGLCFLLTLDCFARGTEPSASRRWLWLAGICCLLGMAAKEIMVSAPLVVLLYDRTFVAGTFRAAWRRRGGFYLGLAGTWLLLGSLMLTSQHRGGSVGFGLGVSGWDYLLTQCRAIPLYLKLAAWPDPLVIDYGTAIVTDVSAVALRGIVLVLLVVVTIATVWRRSTVGFLGAVFFAILAPSSSVVPLVTQPIAEHRMYLPLAAVVVLAVVGLARALGRNSFLVWPIAVLGLCALTIRRNADYHSETSLIQSALAAYPANDRAYLNLGTLASRDGRTTEAIADYERALQLDPRAADTHCNLGAVLEQAGRLTEAIDHYREALRLRPSFPAAQYYLGLALAKSGAADDAIAALARAVQLQPDSATARRSLAAANSARGDTLAQAGRMPEAIARYEAAVQLEPDDARTHNNLANAFAQLGRSAEAIGHYEAALRAAPDYVEAHFNLAIELLDAHRLAEAKTHFAAVLRLRPGDEAAQANLARIAELEQK